ncbi:dipeptidase PepV [Caldicellulosiruptoraceae bacterium PP1]
MNKVKELIDNEIDLLKQEIINSTVELIKIKSVQDLAKENKPFGEGVGLALDYCYNLSKKLGFEANNLDGYAVDGRYNVSNEDVSVIGHIDVVPEGDNWIYPPYEGLIVDNKIYGRGSIDDKGPTIAALYGMYVVKKLHQEKKISLGRSLRFIFGGNEESGSKCLEYYFQHEKYPTIGFTPDADFPVIQGEKGLMIFQISMPISEDFVLIGGERPNMVPDKCFFKAIMDKNEIDNIIRQKQLNEKVEVKENGKFTEIITKGVSAHGSLPFKGINAISIMLDILNSCSISPQLKKFTEFYNTYIGYDVFGKGLGINFEDKKSGQLVFNVGMIEKKENQLILTVNIRYPIDTKSDEIISKIKKITNKYYMEFTLLSDVPPLYVERDHFLVSTLMNVYKLYTNNNQEPLVIGGGTYARSAKNVLAFGPNMPGDEEIAHQSNEYISIDRLLLCAKIYGYAIYKLALGQEL